MDFENLSFEEILKVKNSVGEKKFKKAFHSDRIEQRGEQKLEKRKDKNAPQEITSKKPVTRKRQITEKPERTKYRDPRFESLSGKLNEGLFKRSYGFIHEYQEKEIEMLKQELKKTRDEERKQDLKKTVDSLSSRIQARKMKEQSLAKKRELKKAEAAAVKEGKKPFYLKKSELKKAELMDKYKSIGKGVSLEKFMEKRRKKNAAKEHRKIPMTRRSA